MGKFLKDSLFTYFTKILAFFLGLVSSVIIARFLGPQGKGIYTLALLLPSFLLSFGRLGIGQASIFYIGKKRYPVGEILGNNILFSLFFGIVGFLVGLMIILFTRESLFPRVALVYLFLGLLLIPLRFFLNFVSYILLGLQKIKDFNLVGIFQKVISVILLLIALVILRLGIRATIMVNILTCFIGAIILFYFVKRIIGVFRLSLNKHYIKDAFSYGSKIYLGNLIGFLHYRIDILLVNKFLNPLSVGFYGLAVGIAEQIWLISRSVGLVLFPKVASENDEKRLKEFTPVVCRNVLFITGLAAISLYFLGRILIVFFYSQMFSNSILPFQILLIGIVTMSGVIVLSNDIYGRGRPELNIGINFVSLASNIVLNLLWIPKYGIAGAAWATSVSYTAAFILITIVYCKISGNSIFKTIFIQSSDFKLYRKLLNSAIKRLK